MIVRKLGPKTKETACGGGYGCPGIFELKTGDFAVVGTDITASAITWLPVGSGCSPTERIICVPRQTLVLARHDIPRSV